MKLRELSELSPDETFQVIDMLELDTDESYMSAWGRIEQHYLFDEHLNAHKI